MKFLLWLILLVLCWPLALLALVLYPLVWLFLLPFRLLGIAVEGVLELVRAVVTLPARRHPNPAFRCLPRPRTAFLSTLQRLPYAPLRNGQRLRSVGNEERLSYGIGNSFQKL